MNQERKALFFDVDGTLITDSALSHPESLMTALALAREKGHLTFINSGRTYGLLKQLRNLFHMDGYLCGCGTQIVLHEQSIYSYTLSDQLKQTIIDRIPAFGMDYILEGPNGTYFHPELSRFAYIEQAKKDIEREDGIGPEDFFGSYKISKFCALADEKSDLDTFYKEFSREFDIIDRGDGFYECPPKNHSKATAIEEALRYLNIPLENAYVFGDSTNDLPMFQLVPNAICMGQHAKELEPYASFITKDVMDDGIYYAMKTLNII